MRWLLLVALAGLGQAPALSGPLDVSKLNVEPPTAVTELDPGQMEGDLRQLAWSTDDSQIYIQTAEGDVSAPTLRHYIVPASGGSPTKVDAAPPWAIIFWDVKSGQSAPGVASLPGSTPLVIEAQKKTEKEAGMSRVGRDGGFDSGQVSAANDTSTTTQMLVLKLLGETVGEISAAQPVPGMTFSWAPAGTGAIVYTDHNGRLLLFDQHKHKQTIAGVKEATLPAWSTDGGRLAWAQKSGRRKYTLMTATINLKPAI
jgi:hypothetical protein